MSNRMLTLTLLLLACALTATTGCTTSGGPYLGVAAVPIPVSPYFQKQKEDEFWEHERYARVPILGPITAGSPTVALDPPSDDQVMLALEKVRPVEGGIPLLYETQRGNARIVKELIADYVDPVRVYPLIGPAQQHHSHWKCTVYFTETTRVGWPVPHTLQDEDSVEVVYIDNNHLHMAGQVEPGVGSNY